METTGYAPWTKLESILQYVDLVLFDLKHMDPEIHKRRTGVSNKLILSNLYKTANKVRTWIRIPVIPGFNDSDLDIQRIVDFVSTLPVEKVSILPYHGWGESKYEALGRIYPMKETQPHSEERVNKICEIGRLIASTPQSFRRQIRRVSLQQDFFRRDSLRQFS